MDNFGATDPFWVILWDSPSMSIAVFHRFTDVLPDLFEKIYAGKGYFIRTQNLYLIDYVTRKGGYRSINLSFRACHMEPTWAAHSKTWSTVAPWLREDETCSTHTLWEESLFFKYIVHYTSLHSNIKNIVLCFFFGKRWWTLGCPSAFFGKMHWRRVCKDIVARNIQMGDTISSSLLKRHPIAPANVAVSYFFCTEDEPCSSSELPQICTYK